MAEQEKLLIFVVDDDEMYLKAITRKVSKESHVTVKSFSNGEDCLAAIGEKPDLVLTDFYLSSENPKAMNGDQLLKEIKRVDSNIAVLIMSAQEHADLAATFIKLGADKYIDKNLGDINEAMKDVSDKMQDIKMSKSRASEEKMKRILLSTTAFITMVTILTYFLLPTITPFLVGCLVAFAIMFVVFRRITDQSFPTN